MSVRPSPTVRRRRLRAELRRLREERGLTIEQVQERSGGDIKVPTLSRWETGDRSVRPTDLRLLLDIYEVSAQEREALLTLARQAKARGWWQSYISAIPTSFQTYVGLETEASQIREYSSELVPGLLQTADYYRAFLHTAPAAGSDDEIENKITVRSERQARLTSEDPPDYWAVLNEAVIRRAVGGPEVMRVQLNRIIDLSELTHVSIQVLPFSAHEHPAMEGPFSVLDFPEPTDPEVVYLENQAGSLYLEESSETGRYTRMLDHLIAKALDPKASRHMMARAAADLIE